MQEGQSRLGLHQLLCHWPVGLETRSVGAAVEVVLLPGAVLGLRDKSSPLQKGWAFAGFAKVAGQGAHGVPSAGSQPVPLCLSEH